MNILILNGSPRPTGNTIRMAEAFRTGAESAGHHVRLISVCRLDIHDCRACEACHASADGRGKEKAEALILPAEERREGLRRHIALKERRQHDAQQKIAAGGAHIASQIFQEPPQQVRVGIAIRRLPEPVEPEKPAPLTGIEAVHQIPRRHPAEKA